MHSALNRLQAVFGFFTTVALFVAGAAALSVLLFPADQVTSGVEVKNVQVVKGRPHYYSTKREEYAQMRFDLDADLTPLFNWNTKQLFVYVYATYSSSDKPSTTSTRDSKAIVWDTIVEAPESPYSFNNLRTKYLPSTLSSGSGKRKTPAPGLGKNKNKKAGKASEEPGVFRLRGQKSKYQIADITGRLAERGNITLEVGWNVQPWVGALWWSPRSGAVPRTNGVAGTSKAFDFPELKGSNRSKSGAAAAEGTATKAGA